jgi:hypothetical protein
MEGTKNDQRQYASTSEHGREIIPEDKKSGRVVIA